MRTALELQPRSSSPRVVRRVVRDACARAAIPTAISDNAALAAGELVTTSVRQSHAPLRVLVTVDDGVVTVQVHDRSDLPPAGSAGASPAVGRSWDLVRRLGTACGYRNGADGRDMWASFAATGGA